MLPTVLQQYRTTAARQRRARPAFTLVELLIVLAVLAAVLTLSIPSLRKLAIKGELRNAARQVRVTLLQARLTAIESGGLTYFHYQPGGGMFEAGRGAGSADSTSETDAVPAAVGLDPPDTDSRAAEPPAEPHTLPHGVWFADADTAQPAQPSGAGEELPADESWSAPLVFYPNGRTRNAQLTLFTDAYRIELVVRGLTGTVQISEVQRRPVEDDPAAAVGEEDLSAPVGGEVPSPPVGEEAPQ